MQKKHFGVIVLFLFVAAVRLYFAFQTPYFSSDESYFHLRQIEQIRDTGKPLFEDDLSYGGRTFLFSPVFDYVLAAFTLTMPSDIALKTIPNLLAASLVVIIYFIVLHMTQKKDISLLSAFLAGFVPVYFANTFNHLTAITLVIPALFFLIYSLMRVKKKKWLYAYLGVLVFLSFTSPLVWVFCLGIIIYLMFSRVENLKQERSELEVSLFSLFFSL